MADYRSEQGRDFGGTSQFTLNQEAIRTTADIIFNLAVVVAVVIVIVVAIVYLPPYICPIKA
jgi:hypothetical protein